MKPKTLSLFTLVMLIAVAIDNIRNLPAMALFGSSIIFFFVLSAITFLLPAALVSAELSSTYTTEGGIYAWVRRAFGERWAFLAIWLQWINTMVWYPTILSFIAGTFSYLFDPALAQNKVYLVVMIIVIFWSLTLLILRGLHTSARFASYCAVFGMVLPMALIILLGLVWIIAGHPLQVQFNAISIMPHDLHEGSWISLTAIMTAFLGMELATVYVNDVEEPQKLFPRGLYLATLVIMVTILGGSLAIAVVMPVQSISLVEGVIQVFAVLLKTFHLGWMVPVIVAMLVIGSVGSMINWILSPAKGLMQAANNGYLPHIFRRQNSNGVPSTILITQGILVTLVCGAFLLIPSVNGSYWLLTDLSTELYMIMYVMMFTAAFYLKYKNPNASSGYRIPGGIWGKGVVCFLGLIGTLITLIVGFFPPDNLDVGGKVHYEVVFSSGILLMIVPSLIFYCYNNYQRKLKSGA